MSEDLLTIFNHFKTVLCICPHCDELARVSDLGIHSSEKTTETWLDKYDISTQELANKQDEFDEKESEIRKKAIQRGRSKVLELYRQSIDGQFAKLSYDPYDIKPLLHPIDFVIFDGMNQDQMRDVVLLARGTTNPHMLTLQKSIKQAIENQSYDWKVARVSIDGDVEIE